MSSRAIAVTRTSSRWLVASGRTIGCIAMGAGSGCTRSSLTGRGSTVEGGGEGERSPWERGPTAGRGSSTLQPKGGGWLTSPLLAVVDGATLDGWQVAMVAPQRGILLLLHVHRCGVPSNYVAVTCACLLHFGAATAAAAAAS